MKVGNSESSADLPALASRVRRCRVEVDGVVQGVGFRPFVCRVARSLGLGGSVHNESSGVLIDVQGDVEAIAEFLDRIRNHQPPAAQPGRIRVADVSPHQEIAMFSIEASVHTSANSGCPPPDLAVCQECLGELRDRQDRRYAYPFLNCTDCGPRFTIIRRLPYDRERTSMALFTMCHACREEYEDVRDRRFHAEPTACPACGPKLALLDSGGQVLDVADALQGVVAALRGGQIVAVKGLGGYHLACDATTPGVVSELRRRKARAAKPLAVMVGSLDEARRLCVVSDREAELLHSAARPIVLLERRSPGAGQAVADEVAPRLRHLGLMLPYTPLQHLLLERVDRPLVMTSGNRSDEPIAYEDGDALARLGDIADLFLVHDRPIEVRCDDSVARVVEGTPTVLRRARGYVPLAISLTHEAAEPILACGGELKNVFALVRGREVFLSQHLGDLGDERAYRAWTDAIAHLKHLLELAPSVVAHDLHPGYRSTSYARMLDGVRHVPVQHHHGHIASCLADNGVDDRVIGVAWDGTGYGADGHVWGGEFLLADLEGFERVGSFQEVAMPGGEAAVREPWRMAAVFLQAAYGEGMEKLDLAFVRRLDRSAWRLLSRAAERGLNAPLTSSAGRLFDAVASILGLRDCVDFEAQAAMELEVLAEPEADRVYAVNLEEIDGRMIVRTPDIVRGVVEDILAGVGCDRIGSRFHATLADVIVKTCGRLRQHSGLDRVALSGGVFQNIRLSRLAVDGLGRAGFQVYTHHQVPPNDGGLALGQAAIAARFRDDRRSV
jgi:hydrogenase maturation protein HypF